MIYEVIKYYGIFLDPFRPNELKEKDRFQIKIRIKLIYMSTIQL